MMERKALILYFFNK